MKFGNAFNTCNCFTAGTQGVDVTGTPRVLDSGFDPSTGPWFDTSVFQQPTDFTYGAAAPGLIFGPGFWNLDTSIVKRIPISERYALDLRADFFNFFNHPNFAVPSTTFNTPAFGLISGTEAPGGNRVI